MTEQITPISSSVKSKMQTYAYPCAGIAKSHRPIILLHGWGVDSQVWESVIPSLQQQWNVMTVDLRYTSSDVDKVCDEIVSTLMGEISNAFPLPENNGDNTQHPQWILIGWSLGGMLATRIAETYPKFIKGLITLASNGQFVADTTWRNALSASIFESFYQSLEKESQQDDSGGENNTSSVTLKQFRGLIAQGDSQQRQQRRYLSRTQGDPLPLHELLVGLQLLNTFRNDFAPISVPSLHLLGEKDRLVPSAVADDLRAQWSSSLPVHSTPQVKVINDAGHLLHYPFDRIAPAITHFLERL